MTFATPTRADHQRFCEIEGWNLVRNARGTTGTHHITYELTLPDGQVLRTRISHPPDRSTYGAGIWAHILRDQLDVTAAEFWACVQDRTPPVRLSAPDQREGLPADLVYQLVTRFGVSEAEVMSMTKKEAVARLQACWAQEI